MQFEFEQCVSFLQNQYNVFKLVPICVQFIAARNILYNTLFL